MGQRNLGLDVVRMGAIIPVLTVHYIAFAAKGAPAWIFACGDLGVELFFALSGFLIGGIILRDFQDGFSWRAARTFYLRRWMRTLPLYYVFFIASAFITIYGLTLDQAWSAKCWAYLLFLQNLAWPMLAPWYHESWSLAIEEWLYLLFPILFAALSIGSTQRRVLFVAAVLAVLPLGLRIVFYDPLMPIDTLRKIVLLRLDAIAYGILAIWSVSAFPNAMRRSSTMIGALGVGGIAFIVLIMTGRIDVGSQFFRTLLFSLTSASGAAIVLAAYYQSWGRLEATIAASVVRWLSTRSYALYLCHGSVVRTMLRHGLFDSGPVVSFLIFTSSSLILAEAAHRLIEKPAMRLRPREVHAKTVARAAAA